MRQTNKTKKSGVLRKLFAKISRLMGYELIDQSNLSFVNSSDENNPSIVGKKIINLPLGELKITRKIKSFHIILKTCTSVNLVFMEARLTITRVLISQIRSRSSSPLARRVLPVSTMSTIQSARPNMGAISIAPESFISSTWQFWP